jgi:tetratricopeptide (TPR) repeat protein
VLRPTDAFPRAEAAAQKALQLDDKLGEAYAALGTARSFYYWDFAGAEQAYKRAIELDPNFSSTYVRLGGLLSALGRHDEAIAVGRRGEQVDPLSPAVGTNLGFNYFFARRHDEAIEQSLKIIELVPNFANAKKLLAFSLVDKGLKGPEVFATFSKYKLNDPMMIAYARALQGDSATAMKLINALENPPGDLHPRSYEIAQIYAPLGQPELALDWLERAAEERQPFLIWIQVDPFLEGLHSQPRFQDLLRRVGLPKPR